MATVKVSRTTSCSRAINYAEPRATVKTGVNCDIAYAKSEMKQMRMVYGKDDRVQAHLLIQSFQPGEITAEKANQLGIEYAEKIAPGHQIAIYTHTDKDHIHNHIVINSVNFETGKKFQAHGQAFLNKCYNVNDEICLKHGLSITKRGKKTEKRTMAEIKLKEKKEYVWKDDLRKRIDETLSNSHSIKEFQKKLKKEKNVTVIERGSQYTFSFVDQNGKIRKARSNRLGPIYEPEKLKRTLANHPKELKRQLVGIPNYRYNRETGEIFDSKNWTKTSPIKSQLLETDGKTVYFSGMIYRKEINVEMPEEDWIQGKKFKMNQQQMNQLKQARAREYQRYIQEQFFHE